MSQPSQKAGTSPSGLKTRGSQLSLAPLAPLLGIKKGGPHPSGTPQSKNVRLRPTLPHPHECSTISAVGLSFRVRDVTGRFPHAMTAVTLYPHTTQQNPGSGEKYQQHTHHKGLLPENHIGTRTQQCDHPPTKDDVIKVIGLLVPVSSTSL